MPLLLAFAESPSANRRPAPLATASGAAAAAAAAEGGGGGGGGPPAGFAFGALVAMTPRGTPDHSAQHFLQYSVFLRRSRPHLQALQSRFMSEKTPTSAGGGGGFFFLQGPHWSWPCDMAADPRGASAKATPLR